MAPLRSKYAVWICDVVAAFKTLGPRIWIVSHWQCAQIRKLTTEPLKANKTTGLNSQHYFKYLCWVQWCFVFPHIPCCLAWFGGHEVEENRRHLLLLSHLYTAIIFINLSYFLAIYSSEVSYIRHEDFHPPPSSVTLRGSLSTFEVPAWKAGTSWWISQGRCWGNRGTYFFSFIWFVGGLLLNIHSPTVY